MSNEMTSNVSNTLIKSKFIKHENNESVWSGKNTTIEIGDILDS
jgi:hypothetical protein